MLKEFSWNMNGYIPQHPVNPSDDGIISYVAERIFQLEPEPPSVDNPNEYILAALHTGKGFEILLILPPSLRAAA